MTVTIAVKVTVAGPMSVTETVAQPAQEGDRDSDRGNATNNDYDTGGARQRQ